MALLFTKEFGYFDLYFLLFITIKRDILSAIVNNLINETIFPLKVNSLNHKMGDIWG